jgi:ribulose kinase
LTTSLIFSSLYYQTSYPHPGWATQHPMDWWNALVYVVQNCLREHGVNSTQVIGLAIDAPCDILLTSQDGVPLTEGLMWMDLRATSQACTLTETHDPVLRYCGADVPAEWPVPKVLWLKEHEPDLWHQQSYLVDQMGWLTSLWTLFHPFSSSPLAFLSHARQSRMTALVRIKNSPR